MLRRPPGRVNRTCDLGEGLLQGVVSARQPFITRSRGRLAALASILVSVHVVLFAGAASITVVRPESPPASGPIAAAAAVRERADAYGVGTLTQRFEPALAPDRKSVV